MTSALLCAMLITQLVGLSELYALHMTNINVIFLLIVAVKLCPFCNCQNLTSQQGRALTKPTTISIEGFKTILTSCRK